MQKIIIKNFRAIEYAEIELKKVLVLIGEQATGKSTIAKLIYFFKTIQDDFFVQVYESGDVDLEKLISRKFIEFFGLVKGDFEVEFWFDEEMCLKIFNPEIKISLSGNWSLDKVSKTYKIYKNYIESSKIENKGWEDKLVKFAESSQLVRELRMTINNIFKVRQDDNLYVIAGRNVTVSYSDIFTQYLNSKIQSNISNRKNYDSTDEQLMLKFMERVNSLKQEFKVKGSFRGFYSPHDNNFESVISQKVDEIAKRILKSNYRFTKDFEELRLEKKETAIALSDASSGQQEVIRILQDLLLLIQDKRKFLRIIEEPEAHLFPIAQKELIELLALAVNYQRENQLIIATHSPYILSVFNNLLFANEVVAKDASLKSEVAAVIEEDFWLKAEDFRAYTLGGEEAYCESIMSEDGGMIDQNYLDEVSEILGMEFNTLLELYRSTFKSTRR
jgi:energy-coupling factor transporter ATP-binding protein EcfA2